MHSRHSVETGVIVVSLCVGMRENDNARQCYFCFCFNLRANAFVSLGDIFFIFLCMFESQAEHEFRCSSRPGLYRETKLGDYRLTRAFLLSIETMAIPRIMKRRKSDTWMSEKIPVP